MKSLPAGVMVWYVIASLSSTKEHKVHNLVLYPDLHSWCKITPIKQILNEPGCMSKTFENNVCVGQCFSFSVPKTIPEIPNDDKLHYCDSCRPSNTTWITILLECSDNPDEHTDEVKRRVEIIHDCSCQSCIPISPEVTQDDEASEWDTDYYSTFKSIDKNVEVDNRAKFEALEVAEEEIMNAFNSKNEST